MHLPKLSNHTSWMAAFGLGSTLLRTRLFRSVFFKNSKYDKSSSRAAKVKIIQYAFIPISFPWQLHKFYMVYANTFKRNS